jgi:hypothetical protein
MKTIKNFLAMGLISLPSVSGLVFAESDEPDPNQGSSDTGLSIQVTDVFL